MFSCLSACMFLYVFVCLFDNTVRAPGSFRLRSLRRYVGIVTACRVFCNV